MYGKSLIKINYINYGKSAFTNIRKILIHMPPISTSSDLIPKRYFSETNASSKCLYDLLNVSKNATQADIKSAYYKLSMVYHPDKSNGCEDASRKFREITYAYEVLCNAKARNIYDEGLVIKSQTPSGTSDDAQARFYKQHMRRKDVPHMSGRTPIFDFDEWNRNHYSELFDKKRQRKRNYKYMLYDSGKNNSEQDDRHHFAVIVFFMFLIFIASMFDVDSYYDSDRKISTLTKGDEKNK